MSKSLQVSVIGLDTSHSVEFPRSMNDPNCPAAIRVEGMKAVSCLRFSTPFCSEEVLDERQRQLEEWGIPVTRDFATAVAGCDAIMLTINDPAYHLEYFEKCVSLGKPIFIDKPFADTYRNAKRMVGLANAAGTRIFSASSLRYVAELLKACGEMPAPRYVSVYGPIGKAAAGSSIVWYGVHAFEMLQRAMGRGAVSVVTNPCASGAVCVVEYSDGRLGVVELTEESYLYGGRLRVKSSVVNFEVTNFSYCYELKEIARFFQGEDPADCTVEDALEVMAMLDAAERSLQSGKTEPLYLC